MSREDTALEEARGLMESFLDGSRAPDDFARLVALAAEYDAVRAFYLDQMMLDSQLQEVYGQVPVDVSEPIPFRSEGSKGSMFWRFAAAAVFVIGLGVAWLSLQPSYAAPEASGTFTVVGGDTIERGATLVTEVDDAKVVLGGYCDIAIKPHSQVRLAGDENAEGIVLDAGKVTCDVDRDVGTFEVKTDLGVVTVLGTSFDVEVATQDIGDHLRLKDMRVRVHSGEVQVASGGQDRVLTAGDDQSFGETATLKNSTAAVEAYHLTEQAWSSYWSGDYDLSIKLARMVIEGWQDQALSLNQSLRAYPTEDLRTTYVPLNEVGTCYWVMGEALREKGDHVGARRAYDTLIADFMYAQCWNHQGWWWKPAVAAKKAKAKIDAAGK